MFKSLLFSKIDRLTTKVNFAGVSLSHFPI